MAQTEIMVKKIIPIFGLTLLFMFFAAPTAEAQCAMCRATVENNVSDGVDRIGAGLNFGIMYLLLMPYFLIGTVAWFWYRSSKKDSEQKNYINRIIRSRISKVQSR